MNAVSASHDTHLLKIDNKVDKKNAVVFDLAVFFFGFVVVSLNNQRLFPRVYKHSRIRCKISPKKFFSFHGKSLMVPSLFHVVSSSFIPGNDSVVKQYISVCGQIPPQYVFYTFSIIYLDIMS